MPKSWYKILLTSFSILVLLFSNVNSAHGSNTVRFIFLNVGQGDSLLIITPEGLSVLIDTGPDIKILEALDQYLPSREIDYLIITHPDADHIGGLADLHRSYKLKQIVGEASQEIKYLNLPINRPKHPVQLIGCCVRLDYFNLNPVAEESNSRSLATLISVNRITVFCGGDLPAAIEDRLAREIGDVNVLKVGHHGSHSSTSDYFLSEIKPEIAVISVGSNKYGHPKDSVLAKLSKHGTKIFRTDTDGDIVLKTDGLNLFQIPHDLLLW